MKIYAMRERRESRSLICRLAASTPPPAPLPKVQLVRRRGAARAHLKHWLCQKLPDRYSTAFVASAGTGIGFGLGLLLITWAKWFESILKAAH